MSEQIGIVTMLEKLDEKDARIADLERQLAEEKALADRLYGDLTKLEVIYDALRDKGHIGIDAEDMAIVMRIGHTKAAYRKARGM